MSLLMDALKKAEKARQAEATRHHPVTDDNSPQGLSLDPLDVPLEMPAPAASDGTSDSGSFPDLSIELEDSELVGLDSDPLDGFDASNAGDGERYFGETPPSLALVDEDIPLDDTSATLPSIKAAQASVDSYFDGTQSMSMSMDQVRSATDEADTDERQRVSADPSGQSSARNVFDAKSNRSGSGRGKTVAYVLLILVLLGGVGGGGFFYWQSINSRPGLVPRVASREPLPSVAPAAPAPAVASISQAQPAAPDTVADGTAADSESDTESMASSVTSTVSNLVQSLQSVVPNRGDLTPSKPEPEPSAAENAAQEEAQLLALGQAQNEQMLATLGEPDDVVGNLAAAIERVRLKPFGSMNGAGIKITKRAVADRAHPQLNEAFMALKAGEDSSAGKTYRVVLSKFPDNRDALLGLAAVAVRAGQWRDAGEYYLRLLALNPRDRVAQSALVGLQENIDPLEGESYIKTLLRDEPNAAYLHFNLGNLYAAQSRWPEAQSAFFQAFRTDPDNADYVYNLAVSLDHLTQETAALKFYRAALELADSHYAGFESSAVLRRIQTLSERGAAQ